MASTEWYPNPRPAPAPDGVPDAYRLHPSGLVVYLGHGAKWYSWDTRLPLVKPPSQGAIAAATPLYLSGQAVAP